MAPSRLPGKAWRDVVLQQAAGLPVGALLRLEWRNLLLPLAATAVAFAPSLLAGFTNWDDPLYLTANPYVRHLSWHGVVALLTEPLGGNYNPLPLLAFALEHALWGLEPAGYHVVNLALHLVAVALVYVLTRRLGLTAAGALVASLLFGVHPMRVESVVWIAERKDVLYAVFFLAALIRHIDFVQGRVGAGRAAMLIVPLFLLSLLSKVQAVSLPLAMLTVDLYLRRPLGIALVREKALLFALAAAFGVLGLLVQADSGGLAANSGNWTLAESLVFGAWSFVAQISRLLVPLGLAAVHPFPAGVEPLHVAATAALVGGLLALRSARAVPSEAWRRDVGFGLAFFAVNIVFVLQMVSSGAAFLAERFTYIACIGLCFVLARLYERSQEGQWARPAALAFAAYAGVLGVATSQQCAVWSDSGTLWTDVLRVHPGSVVAYINRGEFHQNRGDAARALADYDDALAIDSRADVALNNRGRLRMEAGDLDAARADIERALAIATTPVGLRNRAALSMRQGDPEAAMKDLDAALALRADYSDALRDRMILARSLGRTDDALADAEAYLLLVPGDGAVRNELGLLLMARGRLGEAIASFDAVIALKPEDGLAYRNRSYAFARAGDRARALADASVAASLGQELEPSYLDSLSNLAASSRTDVPTQGGST
jgi:tetratricopeptide (TPR) repeat protein